MIGLNQIVHIENMALDYVYNKSKGREYAVFTMRLSNGYQHQVSQPFRSRGRQWNLEWYKLMDIAVALQTNILCMKRVYSFEDLIVEYMRLLDPYKLQPFYVKIRLGANKKPTLGDPTCASALPNLEWTENDKIYYVPMHGDGLTYENIPHYDD